MRDISFLTSSLIAHRGIHNNLVKENTILAFEKAMKKKMIIELDIQLTKDNKIVVFHDQTLKRMMGINKKVSSLTYNELNKISTYHIPSFIEVLNLVKGKVPLLIELKPYNQGRILEEEMSKILDEYNGDFAIQSFNPKIIYWFKKNRTNYIRGQLLTVNYNYNFITNLVYHHMLFNWFTKPDFISYNIKGLPNKLIAKTRRKDLIIGWTIRDKKELEKYQDYCDNFIVENI